MAASEFKSGKSERRRFKLSQPRLAVLATSAVIVSAWAALPAAAQENETALPQATVANGDIIVTARKRQESILKVPVVVTAVSQESLESFQVTQVTDLPRLVPGLLLGGNLLSVGPQVTMRGVGTSSYDPGVDQSISLNIDGLSLAQGLAFSSGMFDVAQVEVLKGPQALFYGKSSPGGVISLRTADPGDDLEVIGRAAYDFEAREVRGELVASGPVSDTLGLRVATAYSDGDGYFRNRAIPIESTGAIAQDERATNPRSFLIRGTALWKPVDSFSARLKVNHAYDKSTNAELAQLSSCPDGAGQAFGFGGFGPPLGLSPVDPIPFIGGDDCKFDRNIRTVALNPAFFPGIPNKGVPYLVSKQNFGTLELNYDLGPDLTLTSTTAYYNLKSSSMVNTSHTTAAAPTFAVTNRFSREQFTEELRLNSGYSGPFNFTLGAFYEDGEIYDRVRFIRNRAYGFLSPAVTGVEILNDDRSTTIDIKTYSLFGQGRYKLAEQLELSAGVRWTDETRRETVFDFVTNTDITSTLVRPRVHASNFAPEVTLNYTPTDDLTLFGSFKKGYKSGSFKIAVPAVRGENNAFDDERVIGGEVGVKSRLFDRSLLANIAAYYYEYKGLQVGGIEPSPNGVPVIRTVNAGAARTYGVDFDLAYRPPSVEGLSISASANWNRARYTELNNIGCYANQTIAMGCVNFPNATSLDPETGLPRFTAQELSGTPMIRAPQWTANLGFDYEVPVGSGLRVQLTNNNQFSSKFVTFPAVGRPNNDNYQDAFFKMDASVALKGPEDRWEFALIGKNITNKLTASNCTSSNFAGGLVLGGDNNGGRSPSAAGFSEVECNADAGRSLWVRLTLRPFN